MGCLFSLVQYAADNLGDDRMTIGIIALDEDGQGKSCAFVRQWDRVRRFADGSIEFLEDFVRELESRVGINGSLIPGDLSIEELQNMSDDYQNALRVTTPEFADATAAEWVADFGPLFVRDLVEVLAHPAQRKVRQDEIAAQTRQLFRQILMSRFQFPEPGLLVERTELPTKRGALRGLDAAIVNHGVHFGSIAASLDHELADSQNRVDHVVRSVQDLRAEYKFPLIVVTDPVSTVSISPQHRRELEGQLIGYCGEHGVDVVRSDQPDRIEHAIAVGLTHERLEQLRSGRG